MTTFEDFLIYALDLFLLIHTNMVKIVKDNPQLEKLESQLEDFNTEASFILYGIYCTVYCTVLFRTSIKSTYISKN